MRNPAAVRHHAIVLQRFLVLGMTAILGAVTSSSRCLRAVAADAPTVKTATSAQVPDLRQTVREVDAYLTNSAAFGWSGSVLIGWKEEVLLSKGYGAADRESGRPNNADTLFEIASVSKVLTACAVMKLVEMGKVRLDDPVGKYLPNVPADKSGITVRHLLTHSSGMSRQILGRANTIEEAVQTYLGPAPIRRAGAAHAYWNGGYALLAAIVEVASQQSLEDFSREHVFKPAGMPTTGFTGESIFPPNREAMGYTRGQALRSASQHPYGSFRYQYKGMGGVVTSVNDLWRFIRAWSDGSVFQPETMALLGQPIIRIPPGQISQGLCWRVSTHPKRGKVLSHPGGVAGFRAHVEWMTDTQVAIIVLSNVDDIPNWKIVSNVQAILFGENPRYARPAAPLPLNAEAGKRLAGVYRVPSDKADARDTLLVSYENGALIVSPRGRRSLRMLSREARSPQMERAMSLAEEVIAAMSKGDTEFIRKQLPPTASYVQTWPETLVNQVWPKQVAEYGPLRDVDVTAAFTFRGRAIRVGLSVEHGKEHRSGHAIFVPSGKSLRLVTLDLQSPPLHSPRVYRPVKANDFHSFDWQSDAPLPTLRFEGEGDGLELVVRTGNRVYRCSRLP